MWLDRMLDRFLEVCVLSRDSENIAATPGLTQMGGEYVAELKKIAFQGGAAWESEGGDLGIPRAIC